MENDKWTEDALPNWLKKSMTPDRFNEQYLNEPLITNPAKEWRPEHTAALLTPGTMDDAIDELMKRRR